MVNEKLILVYRVASSDVASWEAKMRVVSIADAWIASLVLSIGLLISGSAEAGCYGDCYGGYGQPGGYYQAGYQAPPPGYQGAPPVVPSAPVAVQQAPRVVVQQQGP